MTACADLRVLFRAPAGPRRGFGHLVRCRSFARALGVRPLIALRGRAVAVEAALGLGCDVVSGSPSALLASLQPDVLIVDDPIAADARRWIAEARKVGCLVVSVHDLGIGCMDADLIIDGSLGPTRAATQGARALTGAEFAVLDPAIVDQRDRVQPQPHRVLIALGGGPHLELAHDIARAIADGHPGAQIRIAGGFASDPRGGAAPADDRRIAWLGTRPGLTTELARTSVAVVGGGVSLYEACALGVPAVGVPVVPAQRPTVSAFVARGAARGLARPATGARVSQLVAEEAVRLLMDSELRRRVGGTARALVDGQGARRAAAAVMAMVRNR